MRMLNLLAKLLPGPERVFPNHHITNYTKNDQILEF